LTIYCEAESQPEGWDANWNPWNRPVEWGYKPATDVSAFEYTSDGTAVTITKYIGEYTEVVIPSTIDGLPVTKIGSSAFVNCSSLTSVVIPDSVTNVAEGSFKGCSKLTSMTLPFAGTTKNASGYAGVFGIIFGYNMVKGSNYGTSTGAAVTANATRQYSELYQFLETKYYDYYIPKSLREITITGDVAKSTFVNCSMLTGLIIADGVTSIAESAFSGCTGLTYAVIADTVTSVGANAFSNCTNLTVYCKADSMPMGWSAKWNASNCPVVWGYKE
jgi:hypothetical protein